MIHQVFLVDDHKVVLDGLQGLLNAQDDLRVVGTALDGQSAVDKIIAAEPDVVVMDISMPEVNGIAAIRQILRLRPKMRILVLSMHTSGQTIGEALRAGAVGYVVKSAPIEEVVEGIRAVMTGRTFLSPEIAGAVVQSFVRGDFQESGKGLASLSEREMQVLQLIAEGKSTKDAARALHLSVKTIESHRRSLMGKLELHSVAELTKYAVREGLTPLES